MWSIQIIGGIIGFIEAVSKVILVNLLTRDPVERVPTQLPSAGNWSDKQVSPHVLRHTCAMVVLQATQDIRKVSLWLGHSNLITTEDRADPTEKLETIEAVVPPGLRAFWWVRGL
jgi:hypothetical protein